MDGIKGQPSPLAACPFRFRRTLLSRHKNPLSHFRIHSPQRPDLVCQNALHRADKLASLTAAGKWRPIWAIATWTFNQRVGAPHYSGRKPIGDFRLNGPLCECHFYDDSQQALDDLGQMGGGASSPTQRKGSPRRRLMTLAKRGNL